MSLLTPCSFAINDTQQLSLFEDGSGFVFNQGNIAFDFHYKQTKEGLYIILNDDASWAFLHLENDTLKGKLYSYISEVKDIHWELKALALVDKPQARTALQAIRFHDLNALENLTEDSSSETLWNELLIEAATCGHDKMVSLCLKQGAKLHVDIESFMPDEKASCFALTKAIQCGHLDIVALLLHEKAQIHHHSFDLDRDNFYHACFLYQTRMDMGEKIIEMLLTSGVDFSAMSAYYLCALMYLYPKGPLHQVQEDIKMLKRVIKAGARLDDFLMITAHDKDTAVMFAAHMGLFKPLKTLVDAGANVFENFEGNNALDRLLTPTVVDPLMPHEYDEEIQIYLESLGLKPKSLEAYEAEVERKKEQESTLKEDDVSSLEALFKNLSS